MNNPFQPWIIAQGVFGFSWTAHAGPTTAPAKPDLSTPKLAVSAFYMGIRDGDGDVLKAATNAPDAAHEKLVASFANYIAARAAFRRVIASKFGADVAPADPGIPGRAQIDAAAVEEHGPRATIHLPGGSGEVVKSGAQWKMAGLDSLPKEAIDPSVAWLDKSTSEMNDAVANVKNGGIKSAEEARPLVAKSPSPFIHVPAPAPH